MQGQAQAIV